MISTDRISRIPPPVRLGSFAGRRGPQISLDFGGWMRISLTGDYKSGNIALKCTRPHKLHSPALSAPKSQQVLD